MQKLGQLLVTGRKWCDFVSYHPERPLFVVRTEAAAMERELRLLHEQVGNFCADLAEKLGRLVA